MGRQAVGWVTRRAAGTASALLIAAVLVSGTHVQAAQKNGAAPLVALSKVDPTIAQDIRYAGENNFTGAPVPGYQAAECWLRPRVAEALARVQADLASQGTLSLLVFDCYRPRRAVRAFLDWVGGKGGTAGSGYHPGTPRAQLVAKGYIGANSSHSRGIAVDLTLIDKGAPPKSPAKAPRDCRDTAGSGGGTGALDMGTTFDCFDAKSHTASAAVTASQRAARLTLKRAMERHGFTNYSREWWHFTYGAADDGRSFDLPVTRADAAASPRAAPTQHEPHADPSRTSVDDTSVDEQKAAAPAAGRDPDAAPPAKR